MSLRLLSLLVVTVLTSAGCSLWTKRLPEGALPPTVAVTSFENRSGYEGEWLLGDGMADLLVSELVASKHFEVLERQHLDPLVGEIELQDSGLFRPEGKVEFGKLKNARFLIRGVVSDFTHVKGGGVGFLFKDLLLGGRGYTARVGLTLTIVDVQTGKIISSVQSKGDAKAVSAYAEANYDDIAFGGDAFFNTPLGYATTRAIRDALKKIVDNIDYDYWQPTVAAVSSGGVIFTGGEKRGVEVGDVFYVMSAARTVTDPQTGDPIIELPGEIVGQVRVIAVESDAAHAEILHGEGFTRGQQLAPAPIEQ